MSTSASSFTRKLAGGAIAVLTLTGALALSAVPAAASGWHHRGHHGHHFGHHRWGHHHGAYGHWVRPRHHCWIAPRRFVDHYGRVHVSHVRVCR
jgi:hypothetical protein